VPESSSHTQFIPRADQKKLAISTASLCFVAEQLPLNATDDTTREMCEQMAALRPELEELWKSLTQSGGVPVEEIRSWRHDIRNLLNGLLGYSEIIKEDLKSRHHPLYNNLRVIDQIAQTILGELENVREVQAVLERNAVSIDIKSTEGIQMTLLVVDDSSDNRTLLSHYLTRLGYQVITASNGADGLDLIDQGGIDVILLDLDMPGLSGLDVLQRLKESQNHRDLPVIMISGVQDMQEVTQCIAAGAEDYLFKPFNSALLSARLNNCVERIQWRQRERSYLEELERNHRFIRSTFGRYLSNDIVESLLDNPDGQTLGGSKRNVAILMADIRSFTKLSERLDAQQVVRILNNYLGVMSDIIVKHGGTVDEFIGDAILALFGAPVEADDIADAAIACAIEMQQAMSGVNDKNREMGLPEIHMGIGVNYGEVVAGNIGSETRAKYGVVGTPVNMASRIQAISSPGEVLASEQVVNAIVNTPPATGSKRTFIPKGSDHPLTLFPIKFSMEKRNDD